MLLSSLRGLPQWAKSATAVLAAVTSIVTGTTPSPPPIHPVINHDFADPGLLRSRGAYYAYSTMSRYGNALWHVPVARAEQVTGRWTVLRDAMPRLPRWVDQSAPGEGNIWAPDVSTRRDGSYLLYFTARSAAQHLQCIGAATAWSPLGPFSPRPDPLVCRPHGREADAIDPSAFTDTDGSHYLLYSSGTPRTTIWLQPTSQSGLERAGGPRTLIVADRSDEAHIVEAPTLVRHGHRYTLFYSGNAFNSGRYFVNYATADSLHGHYTQREGQLLNTATLGNTYPNPGGEDVLTAPHDNFLVFHAYTSATIRALFAVGLHWDHHDRPMLVLNSGHALRIRP